jgi:hypothetical protein
VLGHPQKVFGTLIDKRDHNEPCFDWCEHDLVGSTSALPWDAAATARQQIRRQIS